MKNLIWAVSAVVVSVGLALLLLGHVGGKSFGALTTNFTALNVTDGYYVDDTQVIDGSGNWVGTGSITAGTAIFGFLTQGGGVTATTSTGAGTLTTANVSVGLIEHTNSGATTLTMPASSTVSSIIPTAGQSIRVTYANLGSGIDTLAGGSGTLLHVASSTIATGLKTVAPSGSAVLVFTRKSNSDIIVDMIPAQ